MRKNAIAIATLIALYGAWLIPMSVRAAMSNLSPKSIDLNGETVYKPYGVVYNNTSYMPIWYIMQTLNQLGMANSWDGSSWTIATPTGWQVDFSNIPYTSGSKSIFLNGTLVQRLDSRVYIDPSSGQPTTYMPIWYMMQLLNRVIVTSTWDGSNWLLSSNNQQPATQPRTGKIVFGWTTDNNAINEAQTQAANLTGVGNVNFFIGSDGTLSGEAPATFSAFASSHNMETYATVQNCGPGGFDGVATATLLESPTESANLIQNLVSLVVSNEYSGLDLDIELIPPSARSAFSSFVSQLGEQLKAKGKLLNVDVPAETGPNAESWNGAYDYQVIGQSADTVTILAYDYTWINNPPGAVSPLWWVQKILTYAATTIPANKTVLGIGAYGYDWGTSGNASALSLNRIDTMIKLQNATTSWDTVDDAPYVTYTAPDTTTHVVYYENLESLKDKMSLANQFHLAGIAVWSIGLTDPQFWTAVQSYES